MGINIEKVKKIRESKPFSLWDLAVFITIITAIVILFVFSFSSQKEGTKVVVYVENEFYGEYSLKENTQEPIPVYNKDGKFLLNMHIKDGVVWVTDATSPRRLCELSRISKAPQQIIDLPNRVFIEIVGESDIDYISG